MGRDRDRWNGARYEPGTGHYESWFQRANDATGRRAFWIRYTIFSPERHPGDAVGELWAIAFDRQTHAIVAVKDVVPIAECRFARDKLDVKIGTATLAQGALRGEAASNGHAIAWDLTFTGDQPPLLSYPERLYATRLPRAKTLVGTPLATFRGSFTVDGERIAIADWVGSENHNWGSRHIDQYAWGQVAGFDGAPDAFLECSTARIRLGPIWSPWMAPVLLRLGGETLRWNRLDRVLRARASYADQHWTIHTKGPDGELAITISAEPRDFVALRYPNPPGGANICMNSKLARCELTLRRHGSETRLTSRCAAFEMLDSHGPPGVEPVV